MERWGKVAVAGLFSGIIGAASTLVLVEEWGMQHQPTGTRHVAVLDGDVGVRPNKHLISHFVVYGALGAAIAAIVTSE